MPKIFTNIEEKRIYEELLWENSVLSVGNTILVRDGENYEEHIVGKIEIIIECSSINNGSFRSAMAYGPKVFRKYYSTNVVKQVSTVKNVEFIWRADGKSFPENIDMQRAKAIEIIKNLSEANYKYSYGKIPDRKGSHPVDVYMVDDYDNNIERYNAWHRNKPIYIKFYVENNRTICVVSFHWDEYE